MSRQFKLKNFLRHLDFDFLQQYFQQKGIQVTFPDQGTESARLTALETTIQALPEAQLAAIEADFADITDLATESGVQSLLELSQDRQALAAKIGDIENAYNQALYCFLHEPDLFKSASVLEYVTDLKSRAERTGLKQLTIQEVVQKGSVLSTSLSAYLTQQEGRGKDCEVEVYELANRVCFIARPENYFTRDFEYEAHQLKRVTRKFSFEIIYVYYPEGKLELAARGSKKRQLVLFNLFNEAVLGDVQPVPEDQAIYDLNTILNPDFELVHDPAHQLEKVGLKQLRFASKYNPKNRFTIEVDQAEGLATILAEVQRCKIDLNWYTITQATFQFKFPGKGHKGKVTMQLTNPDRNNLKDKPDHQKAKTYIKSWRLLNESYIESPTT